MRKNLTDKFVASVRPPKKQIRVGPNGKEYAYGQDVYSTGWSGLSLKLTVSFGGARAFSAVTYSAGKTKTPTPLGHYPQLTLKDACSKARELWRDPAAFHTNAEVGSFEQEAEKWFSAAADQAERKPRCLIGPRCCRPRPRSPSLLLHPRRRGVKFNR